MRTRPQLVAPDLELLFAPVLFEEEGLKQPTEDGLTLATVLLRPKSSGTVELRSADPLDPPAIDPRYLTDPGGEDVQTLLQGLRLARRIIAQEPLAGLVSEELLPGKDAQSDEALVAHIRATSQTLYHPIATCRMGTDSLAVVDPELRVRGLEGLRVVDASVMPRLPSGHTNWPTVMIAERAAELSQLASPLDELDAIVVGVADEADPGAAGAHLVRRPLGLDPVLVLQRPECAVEVVDPDRDVAVRGAELVGPTVVVVGELEDVLLIADREEVVRRLELAVTDDVHVAAEGEPERLVERAALLRIGDTDHRVQEVGHRRGNPRSWLERHAHPSNEGSIPRSRDCSSLERG